MMITPPFHLTHPLKFSQFSIVIPNVSSAFYYGGLKKGDLIEDAIYVY
jgi:hypothetical protein